MRNSILLLFLGLICWIKEASAAHIVGGEITYECLGYTNGDSTTNSRTYVFTMRIYRDCAAMGAGFDGAPNGSFPARVTLYQGNDVFLTIDVGAPAISTIDPDNGNPCLVVPPGVCVQEGLYVFDPIDLPIVSEDYTMVYQRCCRNNTIDNIINPGGSGATYTITLTAEAQMVCNNSPSYNAFPPVLLCAGEFLSFDGSATDADGDQLVYEFCAPFLGGGQNQFPSSAPDGLAPDPESPPPYVSVIFDAPTYMADQPLGPDTDFNVNLISGQISGTPVTPGQFVVSLCVSEFRDGQLLSTVRRDFQFNVTANCQNLVTADIQEDFVLDGGESFAIRSCGEFDITLINQSTDQAFIDNYLWEFLVNEDTVRSTSRNFNFEFPQAGTYNGIMAVNPGSEGCSDTVNVTVLVSEGIMADFAFEYDTCVAEAVNFSDLSIAPDGIVDYQWRFGDGIASSDANPDHLYEDPGNFVVELAVGDAAGCRDSLVQNVPYFPVPGLIIISPNASEFCVPGSIFLDNLSSPIDDTYQVAWDFGDGGRDTIISPSYTYEAEGLYSVEVEITSPIGCVTDTIFEDLVLVEPRPIANFSYSPGQVDFFNREIQLEDASIDANRWFWAFGDFATSTLRNPIVTLPDSGLVSITQVVTHPRGCVDSLTQFIDVVPVITYYMPTAFTPNGDGKNDVFIGKGFLRGFRSFNLQIWNRWGEQFFQSDDPLRGWDGRIGGGQDAPPGVYLYQYDLIGPRGEPISERGTVTLLR